MSRKSHQPSRRKGDVSQNSRKGNRVNPNSSVAIHQSEHFQGPLPPPHLLEKYEELLPGFTEKLLESQDKEMAHRQKIEEREAKDRSRVTYFTLLGIVTGFIAFAAYLYIVYFSLNNGYGEYLSEIIGYPLATIVIGFITRKAISMRKETN